MTFNESFCARRAQGFIGKLCHVAPQTHLRERPPVNSSVTDSAHRRMNNISKLSYSYLKGDLYEFVGFRSCQTRRPIAQVSLLQRGSEGSLRTRKGYGVHHCPRYGLFLSSLPESPGLWSKPDDVASFSSGTARGACPVLSGREHDVFLTIPASNGHDHTEHALPAVVSPPFPAVSQKTDPASRCIL